MYLDIIKKFITYILSDWINTSKSLVLPTHYILPIPMRLNMKILNTTLGVNSSVTPVRVCAREQFLSSSSLSVVYLPETSNHTTTAQQQFLCSHSTHPMLVPRACDLNPLITDINKHTYIKIRLYLSVCELVFHCMCLYPNMDTSLKMNEQKFKK